MKYFFECLFLKNIDLCKKLNIFFSLFNEKDLGPFSPNMRKLLDPHNVIAKWEPADQMERRQGKN